MLCCLRVCARVCVYWVQERLATDKATRSELEAKKVRLGGAVLFHARATH